MDDIFDGIRRFRHEIHPAHRELFEQLAHGQHPEVLFVTCADSRVVPALITQTAPGQLFVLRNAGNLVPPVDAPAGGEAATIQYAVEELCVSHVVICGHVGCGAIAAVMSEAAVEGPLAGWLAHAAEVRQRVPPGDLAAAVAANVLVQLGHLRGHPSVAEAEAAGRLTLHGWVYDIGTGEIRAFDAKTGAFLPLDRAHGEDALVHELKATPPPPERGWIDHGPWSVWLDHPGRYRSAVIEAVRQVVGVDEAQAAALAARAPVELLHGLDALEAEVAVAWLADAGAAARRVERSGR